MSLVEMWPVLGIEVRTPAVELFVPDQDTLDVLARLAAEGIYDPQNQYLPRTPVGGWEDVAPPEAERRFLRYFCAFADWRPERWNLLLAAKAGDDIVGVQEIGAQHFGVTRTVSTGSWIGRRYQGAGYKGRPGEPRSPPATAQPRPGRRVPSPEGRRLLPGGCPAAEGC